MIQNTLLVILFIVAFYSAAMTILISSSELKTEYTPPRYEEFSDEDFEDIITQYDYNISLQKGY